MADECVDVDLDKLALYALPQAPSTGDDREVSELAGVLLRLATSLDVRPRPIVVTYWLTGEQSGVQHPLEHFVFANAWQVLWVVANAPVGTTHLSIAEASGALVTWKE